MGELIQILKMCAFLRNLGRVFCIPRVSPEQNKRYYRTRSNDIYAKLLILLQNIEVCSSNDFNNPSHMLRIVLGERAQLHTFLIRSGQMRPEGNILWRLAKTYLGREGTQSRQRSKSVRLVAAMPNTGG